MRTLLRLRSSSRAATGLLAASMLITGCSVSAIPSAAEAVLESAGSPATIGESPSALPSTVEVTSSVSPEASPSSTPLPTIEPAPTSAPTPTPTPEPIPTSASSPTPEPSERPSASPPPTPTPWPFAAISGIGHLEGRPFTIEVWIDHEGGAHGFFDGSVADPSGPIHVTGAVTCARIDGNIGVFGGRADWTDFVVMVSDRPNGMIIGTGRPDCDTTGFGDPASSPTTDGDIHVIPEP